MQFHGRGKLPQELIEDAISSYQFDNASSTEEEMLIRQWKHTREFEEFDVEVVEEDGELVCSYKTLGQSHTRRIPKTRQSVTSEVYPIGDVEFEQLELMAVNLTGGFPWTSEAFVAWYWATPKMESLEDEDEWFQNVQVLQQYFPPREITGEPTPCTVRPGQSPDEAEFMTVDVRNATHCKAPNPWAYAALMVVYENPDVATKLLNHEDVYGENDDYELTPPHELGAYSEQ